MKVLVACEESQTVCKAFREKGHEAYSCDIQPCSGGHPEWHIQKDVILLLNGDCTFQVMTGEKHSIRGKWDLIIGHPPCTYLSRAGSPSLFPKGVLNQDRYEKGIEAKAFFMKILNADSPRIAVENPTPNRIYDLPTPSCVIEPYEFGHPFKKRTLLWLKGLPPLLPTYIINPLECESTKTAVWYNGGGKERQKNRSKTFSGIAKAMADQWG